MQEDFSKTHPVRMPVWWGRRGAVGPHPDLPGVSGRYVMIRHRKNFRRFEGFLARLFRAPKELRRPLDDMNSLLWELCDGERSFEQICDILDEIFHERIAPVKERTTASLERLSRIGLIGLSHTPFEGDWDTGPGIDPSGELDAPPESLGLEWVEK